jgi:enamine deaminase RidA (YjgF/YER057c/UK114 family)
MQSSAEQAFEQIEQLLDQCGLSMGDVVKQWNYLERMLEKDFSVQRYQIFNDVRTRYYDQDFEGRGYPASTETGMLTGGLIIEFLAVKGRNERSLTVNNPIQKAPYEYSSDVLAGEGAYNKTGPTTPKLERARSLTIDQRSMLFISGTSSIIGERLTAGGDVAEQTVTIIETIKKLLERKNLEAAGLKPAADAPKLSLLKIYVAKAADFDQVYHVIEAFMGKAPTLMVQATLPRKEILVEIEAEMLID